MNKTEFIEELRVISENLRRSTVYVREGISGVGSGVIWDGDGTIATNAHVVRGMTAKVELSDGRIFEAKVTARDIRQDLVALKINGTNLPSAIVGDSDRLRVGEFVLAVGNPLGQKGVVTTGIIHSLSTRSPLILTDVALAPGNSGGILADSGGRVIGINTAIVNGLGLAIPSKTVEQFLRASQNYSAIEKPFIGVTLQPVLTIFAGKPLYGLQTVRIEAESPAQTARLHPGDILIGSRGKAWQTPNQLWQILDRSRSGDRLSLDFLRGDKQMVANIVLCNRVSQTTAV
jgi:serine protease Do